MRVAYLNFEIVTAGHEERLLVVEVDAAHRAIVIIEFLQQRTHAIVPQLNDASVQAVRGRSMGASNKWLLDENMMIDRFHPMPANTTQLLHMCNCDCVVLAVLTECLLLLVHSRSENPWPFRVERQSLDACRLGLEVDQHLQCN